MTENDRERQLEQREAELRQREIEIRLRELDSEINQSSLYQPPNQSQNQPPIYETRRHSEPERRSQRLIWQVTQVAKFLGVVIAVLVAVRIASWLASIIIVGAVAWVIYQIFLAKDHPKSK
jgi:hypothetical protein